MSESDNSPVQRTGMILWRSCGKGRFAPFCGVDSVSVRCELVEITVGGFRTEGAGEAGGGGGLNHESGHGKFAFREDDELGGAQLHVACRDRAGPVDEHDVTRTDGPLAHK